MKTYSTNTPKVFLVSINLFLGLALFSSSRLLSQSNSNWEVRGRKINWTMNAPDGWIGGNYYQINEVIQEIENPTMRLLLENIQEKTTRLDVYLIQFDDAYQVSHNEGNYTTQNLTRLSVNVIDDPVYANIDQDGFIDEIWNSMIYTINLDYESGSITEIAGSSIGTVGSYDAYLATFVTETPAGGSIYTMYCLIQLSQSRIHIFEFETDAYRYDERSNEFIDMLNSIEYD